MKAFTAACAQFAVIPNEPARNVALCATWINRAADESGAELVVLPETVTTGFNPACPSEALWEQVDSLPGRLSEPLQQLAQRLRIHIVFPSYERGPQPTIVYNSAALIGPSGDLLGVYRKTHLFPTERKSGGGWSTAGQAPCVVETALGRIGLTICYDGDFPELYRVEALQGAEVIVRPSALLRSFEIWELTNQARAYDNHVYIVACNAVGPDAAGAYYFGHSMIVDPIAHKLAQARGTEEIIAATLDPDPIKRITYGAQSPMIFDHLQDRNLAAYEGIMQAGRSPFEPARRITYLAEE